MARLLHPSIVRIYGVFKDGGLYWFEMERVHGPTLKDALVLAAVGKRGILTNGRQLLPRLV